MGIHHSSDTKTWHDHDNNCQNSKSQARRHSRASRAEAERRLRRRRALAGAYDVVGPRRSRPTCKLEQQNHHCTTRPAPSSGLGLLLYLLEMPSRYSKASLITSLSLSASGLHYETLFFDVALLLRVSISIRVCNVLELSSDDSTLFCLRYLHNSYFYNLLIRKY